MREAQIAIAVAGILGGSLVGSLAVPRRRQRKQAHRAVYLQKRDQWVCTHDYCKLQARTLDEFTVIVDAIARGEMPQTMACPARDVHVIAGAKESIKNRSL